MLFERLARRGSAKGAYAAGRTYDPEFLKSVRVVGLAPNVKKAKDWYARAAALEQPEAAQRLGRP
jgi:TPR repeat protein